MGNWTSTYTQRNRLWLGPQRLPNAARWLPMLFMLAVIAAESTRTAGTATTEHLLLACTHRLHVATQSSDIITTNWELRKVGHFLGYGMLGLLTARCRMRRISTRTRLAWNTVAFRAASLGILCAATIASLDEWHQSFLPGRCSSVRDVVLDTLGAITCILVYLVRNARRRCLA